MKSIWVWCLDFLHLGLFYNSCKDCLGLGGCISTLELTSFVSSIFTIGFLDSEVGGGEVDL